MNRGQKRYFTLQKVLLVVMGILLVFVSVWSYITEKEHRDMTNLEFFQSLDYEDGLDVVVRTLDRFPLQYAATLGQDGNPQVRPIEFKFEKDGVLYFDTVEFYTSYKEMKAHPYLQLCVCDLETMTYLRLGGRVNFTKNEDIVSRCFAESPILTEQFGEARDMVVAYYLTEVWAEIRSFSPELPQRTYLLRNCYDT